MTKKAEPSGLDPRSERVVLVYAGDGSADISGVPARDLTESDVCRLAFIRGTATDAVLDELTTAGLYSPAKE